MRLTVEHLGRIRHAELDLRPLTVFVGENNTNKSWTAYAVYRAWSTLSVGPNRALPPADAAEWFAPGLLDGLVTPLDNLHDRATLSFSDPRHELLAPGSRSLRLADEALSQTLGVSHLERARVALEIPRETLIGSRLAFSSFDAGGEAHRLRTTVQLHASSGALLGHLARPVTREALATTLFPAVGALFDRVVPLPVERVHRDLLLGARGSWPSSVLADAADALRTLPSPRDSSVRSALLRILGVRPRQDDSLEVELPDGSTLPFGATSSLVRSLMGLDRFVAAFGRAGNALVIDEPEMNAHPRAQLAIAELLAMLARSGVQVLVTTHSPYLVDHLSNLMNASRLPVDAQHAVEPDFELGTRQAFLPAEDLAVYEFRGQPDGRVEVHDILDRDAGLVELSTFARQTDRLNALYGRLLDLGRGRATG